jgi:hypothetical protein
MIKRWEIKKHHRAAVNSLAAELRVKPLVAALLIARGHDTVEKVQRFLNPAYEHLHDPLLLKGMREAVDAILQGRLNPRPLYTDRFRLDEIAAALDTLRERPSDFMKALVIHE